MRIDGREPFELRPIKFQRGFSRYAEGSVLVEWGNTKVLCTASVEDKVPPFMRGTGKGWISAEYSMLPKSTHQRTQTDTYTHLRAHETKEQTDCRLPLEQNRIL